MVNAGANVFNLRQLLAVVGRGMGITAVGERENDANTIDWLRVTPFIAMHLACLGVFWVGWSPVALWVAAGLYGLRMFAITGFYHRYFSHRAFRTSRALQMGFAVVGAAAAQRGPVWWSAHHRHHHATADTAEDPHSPVHHGFWYSHVGWFLTTRNFPTRTERVRDWLRFPELKFLDRYDGVVPLALGLSLYFFGEWLQSAHPASGTNGAQLLVWGLISTVALYHATFTINSLAHRWGFRRYANADDSRNNPLLAVITLGEGWHNNHHKYPASGRQGIYWWEIDITWYLLLALEKLGLIWDLKRMPKGTGNRVPQRYIPDERVEEALP